MSSSSSSSSSSVGKGTRKTPNSVKEANDEIASRKFASTPSSEVRKKAPTVTRKPSIKSLADPFELIEAKNLDGLKELIKKAPGELKKKDRNGKSLMIAACEKDQDAIVKYLAENSEDLISTDTPTGTPL